MVINEVTILVWIVCGIATFLIAQSRGATNAPTWLLVGIVFGPIGILLAVIGAKAPTAQTGPLPPGPAWGRPPAPAGPTWGQPAAPAAAPAPSDPETALANLAGMRDRGLITAADYEAKKTEVLARL
jgi:hypothetical protein